MVWNHSFGQSPLLQMYFDRNANKPAADNPWYSEPIYKNPGMNFGYKFDHGSTYFVEFMDRANAYWLNEYKVDGFRFDLTKGFTTRFKGDDDPWGSKYDQERVDNLVRMYNEIKKVNPDAYVILEHLADNPEETALANAGMLMWGKMTERYNEATMGYHESGKSNLSGASYKQRGWNQPHLIAYMESHDEERLMFKNLAHGRVTDNYSVKDLTTALRRMELAGAFFFTIPGPKMIWQFGERGYDVSIDDGGRLGMKPPRWNYMDDWRRKRLYDVYAALIELKKEHDVFRTTDFTLSTNAELKRIHLNHASNNVTVLGNFDVVERVITPNFQKTGTWHEFFSRTTLEVTDVNATITLKPGEYRLYSTEAFPDHGLSLNTPEIAQPVKDKITVFPNPSSNGFNFRFNTQKSWNLQVYNIQGQMVYEKQNAFGPSDSDLYWNGRGRTGKDSPSGLYFYKIMSQEETLSGKIMIR
jgi:1,4-alpha-glucan branching enzyme